MSVIFLSISIALFVIMNSVKQYKFQYYSPFDKSDCDVGQLCRMEIYIEKDMDAPVYFMYEVGNFYQNHRRYIQSKSNEQLAGNNIQPSQSKVCWPYETNEQMQVSVSWSGQPLEPKAIASPCGAIGTFCNMFSKDILQ